MDRNISSSRCGEDYAVNKRQLSGVIFMCNKETMVECFRHGVFGLPISRRSIVEQIVPGMMLFLFEYESRELHGIYEARSFGGMNLEPHAYKSSPSSFPCQVRFRTVEECAPLLEFEFKEAIRDNYISPAKFRFDLTEKQVCQLVRLFLQNAKDTNDSYWISEDISTTGKGVLEGKLDHSFHLENPIEHPYLDRVPFTSNRIYSPQAIVSLRGSSAVGHGLEPVPLVALNHLNSCQPPLDCHYLCMERGCLGQSMDPVCLPASSRPTVGQGYDMPFPSQHCVCSECSSLMPRMVSEEEHQKNSIHRIGPELDLGSYLCCDKFNEKPSVWSRISGRLKECEAAGCVNGKSKEIVKTKIAILPKRIRSSSLKDDVRTLNAELDIITKVAENADVELSREEFFINFKRRKCLIDPCNSEDNSQKKRRKKLIRPDFTSSARSTDQSGQKPELIGKRVDPLEPAIATSNAGSGESVNPFCNHIPMADTDCFQDRGPFPAAINGDTANSECCQAACTSESRHVPTVYDRALQDGNPCPTQAGDSDALNTECAQTTHMSSSSPVLILHACVSEELSPKSTESTEISEQHDIVDEEKKNMVAKDHLLWNGIGISAVGSEE
eukprot:c26608_g1_i1 orf=393-2228(-)